MKMIFDWANDAEVRKNSFQSNIITFEEHINWYQAMLNNPKEEMYLFLVNQKPAGKFNFRIQGREAMLGYSLCKEYRGKGLGIKVIEMALEILKQGEHQIELVNARVKKNNIPSRRIFTKLGFREIDYEDYSEYQLEYKDLL